MSKEPKDYLRHIQEECSYIISVTKNHNSIQIQ